MPATNQDGSTSGMMGGYGRGRNSYWNSINNWNNKKEQKPLEYNLDLKSLQEGAVGMLPGAFAGAALPLGQGLGLATQIGDEENRRQQAAFEMIRKQLEMSNRMDMGMTPDEINLRLGQVSDAATESMMQNASAARSMLGASGVFGGSQAAAMEGALRLGRMAQIQGGRTKLAVEEAARRADAANSMFERTGRAAEFLSQGPSMLQLDQLNSMVDVGLNAFIGERQAQAAKSAAKDNKRGGIASAVIGALPIPKVFG